MRTSIFDARAVRRLPWNFPVRGAKAISIPPRVCVIRRTAGERGKP
jgi:hypothetical protein